VVWVQTSLNSLKGQPGRAERALGADKAQLIEGEAWVGKGTPVLYSWCDTG